jgi:hypothetical protein
MGELALAVKFGADVKDLQAGVAEVNRLMTTQVTKGLNQAAQASSAFGGSLGKTSSALSSLGPLLGGLGGEFSRFGGAATRAVFNVQEAVAFGLKPALAGIGGAMLAALPIVESVGRKYQQILHAVAEEAGKISLALAAPELKSMLDRMAKGEGLSSFPAVRKEEAKKEQERLFKDRVEAHRKAMRALGRAEEILGESMVGPKIAETKDALLELDSILGEVGERNPEDLRLWDMSLALSDLKRLREEEAAASQARRDLAAQEKAEMGSLADRLIAPETPALLAERQTAIAEGFKLFVEDLKLTVADWANLFTGTFEMMSQGVGDALARVIVFQESFSEQMKALGKQVLATIISYFVQLIAAEAAYFIAKQILGKKDTGAAVGQAAAQSFAWGFASVMRAVPFPKNLVLAPLVATAAAVATIGGASAALGAGAGAIGGGGGAGKIPKAAKGAYITDEGLIHAHPDELIAPRSRFERLMEGGGRPQVINIILDGQVLARAIVPHIPGELTIAGVRG